jgi:hypothetical protein
VRTILKIVRTMHSVIGGSGWPRRGNPETKWRRLSSAGVRARAMMRLRCPVHSFISTQHVQQQVEHQVCWQHHFSSSFCRPWLILGDLESS